ncbi:MAG: hypothetical protein IT449_10645 [Phycisphaerales bacterium]|nr:hypothetical protein [Phycisphaerales bacterium]
MRPRVRSIMLFVATASCAGAVRAEVTLDFEGLGSQSAIGSAYASMGFSFSHNFRSIVHTDFGGTGKFEHNPSGIGVAGWVGPRRAAISSIDGFVDAVGLHYSSSKKHTLLNIWSGENATGDLLASYDIARNADRFHTEWDEILVPFTGVAHSIQFVGKAGKKTYIDDVTLTLVPVPAAAGLGLLGLALAQWVRKRTA